MSFMPRPSAMSAPASRASSAVLIDITAAGIGRSGVARWIEGFREYLDEHGVEYDTADATEWARATNGFLRYLFRWRTLRDVAYYSIHLRKLSVRYRRVVILDNIARLMLPLPASALPFYLIHDVIPFEMDARFVRERSGWWAAFRWAVTRWLYRWRIKQVLFAPGARFGYVSRATREAAIAFLGEPARRGTWIGPMVLPRKVRGPETDTSKLGAVKQIRQRLVLAVGTGDPKKGLDTLLRAWRAAAVSGSMKLVLFGDSWNRSGHEWIESKIRALQLENIAHVGRVTDEALHHLYRNAAALVFPSRFEGLGLPPAEYCQYGAGDLLLRDIPALREIYADVARFFSSEEELTALLRQVADPRSEPLMDPTLRRAKLQARLDAAKSFARLYAAIRGEYS